MALVKTSVDRAALPAELLPLVKSHLHVEFDRDDAYISSAISRAIGLFELSTGYLLNPAVYTWTPGTVSESCRLPVPVQPAVSLTGLDGEGAPIDITVEGFHDPDQVSTVYVSAGVSGATVTIETGFPTAAELPPAALNAVLLITGRLYEYREQYTSPVMQTPGWVNDLLVGHWVPRV
jgi:uncharacterized phiE125 gp8 family phage protein